jgi:hypothetical protein
MLKKIIKRIWLRLVLSIFMCGIVWILYITKNNITLYVTLQLIGSSFGITGVFFTLFSMPIEMIKLDMQGELKENNKLSSIIQNIGLVFISINFFIQAISFIVA